MPQLISPPVHHFSISQTWNNGIHFICTMMIFTVLLKIILCHRGSSIIHSTAPIILTSTFFPESHFLLGKSHCNRIKERTWIWQHEATVKLLNAALEILQKPRFMYFLGWSHWFSSNHSKSVLANPERNGPFYSTMVEAAQSQVWTAYYWTSD